MIFYVDVHDLQFIICQLEYLNVSIGNTFLFFSMSNEKLYIVKDTNILL